MGIESLLASQLSQWDLEDDPLPQHLRVQLIGTMLRAFGDPDWEYFKMLERGVRIGVGVQLPRTPLIFPEKVRWRVPGQESADPDVVFEGTWRANDISAMGHRTEVEAALR